MGIARRVDIDFIVQTPFKHLDIKTLVDSEILKKQL